MSYGKLMHVVAHKGNISSQVRSSPCAKPALRKKAHVGQLPDV